MDRLLEYRKLARKGQLNEMLFDEVVNIIYNHYLEHRNEFEGFVNYLKHSGRINGVVDIAAMLLINSSPDVQVVKSRYMKVYKLLTALYLTPFKAIRLLEAHVNKVGAQIVVIKPDSSTGDLSNLQSYVDFPQGTSIVVSGDKFIVLLS